MSWRSRTRRLLPYLVGAGGGFMLGYLIVFLFVFPGSVVPDEAKLPNVTGLHLDDAVRRLRMAGFDGEQGEQRYHASAPEGTVLEQQPVGGTMMPRGTMVTMSTSKGQLEAQVPRVVGLSRRQAQTTLQNAGFVVGDVLPQPSDAPRGEVIAMRPLAGTTHPIPSAVNLTVSSGPSALDMPDVVGQSYPQARVLLEQLGLEPAAPVYDSTSYMPEYTVLAQSPLPGVAVAPGTAVTLRVAGRSP